MSEDDATAQATRALQRILRLYQSASYRHGLRPAQWEALRYFASCPGGAGSVTGLARYRVTTIGSTSVLVSKLVEKGVLERNDGFGSRNVDVRLSARGWELVGSDPALILERAIADLGPQSRAEVARQLGRLEAAVETKVEGAGTSD